MFEVGVGIFNSGLILFSLDLPHFSYILPLLGSCVLLCFFFYHLYLLTLHGECLQSNSPVNGSPEVSTVTQGGTVSHFGLEVSHSAILCRVSPRCPIGWPLAGRWLSSDLLLIMPR